MNAQLAHIVEEIKGLSYRDHKELKHVLDEIVKEEESHEEYLKRKRKAVLPSFKLGGAFDNIDIRKAAYEE